MYPTARNENLSISSKLLSDALRILHVQKHCSVYLVHGQEFTNTSPTNVARLWAPRVSPRRQHKFHGGE